MKKFILPTIGLLASLLAARAQTPVFTPGDVVVMRLSGQDATTGTGCSMIVDEFAPSAVASVNNTPAYSFAVPNTSQSTALITVGLAYAGLMTETPDNAHLVIPGYNQILSTSTSNPSFNSAISRAAGSLDAYGNFSLPIVLPNTVFSGFSLIGAASDGTNYWMAANGPASEFVTGSYPNLVYVGTAASQTAVAVMTNTFSSTVRAVNCFYNSTAGAYGLYVNGTSTNTPTANIYHGGCWAVSNISGALPETKIGASNYFPNATATGGSTAAFDIAINPAGTTAYMADNDNGIVKYTYSGGVWTSNYTVQLYTAGYMSSAAFSESATSVTADWSQSPPVVYATSGETFTNRLVKFSDTGATPTVICMATNATPISGPGGVTNTFRGVRLAPTTPPVFTTSPMAVSTVPGATATFTAAATGYPTPTYQWYSNSMANPTYVLITGATSATLSLPSVTQAQGGSLFYVVASNTYGSPASTPVALTVANPAITTEPMGVTNFISGPNVTLSVSAIGTGTLTYQWFLNGVAIGGANGSSYTVNSSPTPFSGTYTVNVTNTAASTTVAMSSPAIVAYTPYLLFDNFTYPDGNLFGDAGSPWTDINGSNPEQVISDQVQINVTNATTDAQSLFFESTAGLVGGTPVLWASFTINVSVLPSNLGGVYFANLEDNNFGFVGRVFCLTSNNPSLTPGMSANAFPGTYRLGIANGQNDSAPSSSTGPASVIPLDLAPGITYEVVYYVDMNNQISGMSVNPASYSDVVEAGPTGQDSGPAEDAWPSPLGAVDGFGLRQRTGGGVMLLDNLEVSYDYGSPGTGYTIVTSDLTPAAPVIGLQPVGTSNYTGNSFTMEVCASGVGATGSGLTYAWYQSPGGLLANGPNISGQGTPALTINSLSVGNDGTYTVVVTGSAGGPTTSAPTVIAANTTPTAPFFVTPTSASTNIVAVGSSETFTAYADGSGPIAYEWWFNDGIHGNQDTHVSGPTLSQSSLMASQSGTYTVVATGAQAPAATSPNFVLVVQPPQPVSIAYLRSLATYTPASSTITLGSGPTVTANYSITGSVTVGATLVTSEASFYIQDASGAGIDFFVNDSTFRPKMGDVVTVIGTLSVYNNDLELDASKGSAIQTYVIDNTANESTPGNYPYTPVVIPLGFVPANLELTASNYEGSLVMLTNVFFTQYAPSAVFASEGTYNLSSLSDAGPANYGIVEVYSCEGANLSPLTSIVGEPIPQFAYSIVGVMDEYQTSAQLDVTRYSDIVTTPPPATTISTNVAISAGCIMLNWQAVPYTYAYSVQSSTNVAGPYTNLSSGLVFATTNGTYTDCGPAAVAKFYKIVSP